MPDLLPFADPCGFMSNRSSIRAYQEPYARLFTPGARVLDVGCGQGAFLDLLSEHQVHGVGVDCHLATVESVRKRGRTVVQWHCSNTNAI